MWVINVARLAHCLDSWDVCIHDNERLDGAEGVIKRSEHTMLKQVKAYADQHGGIDAVKIFGINDRLLGQLHSL